MFRFIFRALGAIIYLAYVLILRIINIFSVTRNDNIDEVKDNKWIRVRPHEECVCANGKKHYMYFKKGNVENLLIYFSGGGLAWDKKSAHFPMGAKSFLKGEGFGYYVNQMFPFSLHPMKGMLDIENKANPCKGWSVAYLPYTTGDFHIGASRRELEYKSKRKKVIFGGKKNAEKSLEYVFEKYKNPKNIIVCGESAGAFGSSFYVRQISENYPNSNVIYVCDSAHLRYENWNEVLKLWDADTKRLYGFEVGCDLAKHSLIKNSEVLKEKIPQLMINTMYDKVLSEFRLKILGKEKDIKTAAKEWNVELKSVVSELKEKADNCYMFLAKSGFDSKTGTTRHVITRSDMFYTAREEGMSVSDWVKKALDGELSDVGMSYLKE